MLRTLSIECVDRLLGHARHLVDSAMAEVDDFLWMPQRPSRINRRSRVARVGGGARVSLTHGHTQLHVVDKPGESAVAKALQLAVPPGDGQPDFELDIGVRSRLRHRHDAAKCRKAFVKSRHVKPTEWSWGTDERPGSDGLRERYRGPGDLCPGQLFARVLGDGDCACREQKGCEYESVIKMQFHNIRYPFLSAPAALSTSNCGESESSFSPKI